MVTKCWLFFFHFDALCMVFFVECKRHEELRHQLQYHSLSDCDPVGFPFFLNSFLAFPATQSIQFDLPRKKVGCVSESLEELEGKYISKII